MNHPYIIPQGQPLPKREWVELTNKEIMDLATIMSGMPLYLALIEKFKEKNT